VIEGIDPVLAHGAMRQFYQAAYAFTDNLKQRFCIRYWQRSESSNCRQRMPAQVISPSCKFQPRRNFGLINLFGDNATLRSILFPMNHQLSEKLCTNDFGYRGLDVMRCATAVYISFAF
jgi:hypothetical protein